MMAVAPGLQMPTLPVEMNPIERAVGDREIAWRIQRAASGATVDHVEHAAMADRGDRLAAVMPHQPVDRLAHPPGKAAQRLTRPEIVVEIARHIVRIGLRIPFGGRRTVSEGLCALC